MTNTLIAAAVIGWALALAFAIELWIARRAREAWRKLADEHACEHETAKAALGTNTEALHGQLQQVLAAYQALVADTPARGQDGKFVERE